MYFYESWVTVKLISAVSLMKFRSLFMAGHECRYFGAALDASIIVIKTYKFSSSSTYSVVVEFNLSSL